MILDIDGKNKTILEPKNRSETLQGLFYLIDRGQIKIPKFQRDFVWSKEQTAHLIDSIIKGYPIGTFILWKTHERMASIRNIGNAILPEPPDGDVILYVLDGQQRLTSLYAVTKGVLYKGDVEMDFKSISINLSIDPSDEKIVITDPSDKVPSISVYKLLNGSLNEFTKDYLPYIDKIDLYRNRLFSCQFSIIELPDYPIDIACEVFTRINTSGKTLTMFQIMVAKTYDKDRNFDLAEKYDALIDNDGNTKEKDLKSVGYDTITPETLMQCVAACVAKKIGKRDILKIKKNDFIDKWPDVSNGLCLAVDFLRRNLNIQVSQLLPYNALLIPLTYFYVRNYCRKENPDQSKRLAQFFWWASIGQRYSQSMDSNVEVDLLKMDDIFFDKQPSYRGEEVRLSPDQLIYYRFNTSNSFCKAILCLYAHCKPQSFSDNSPVLLDNSWLRSTNSRNYHHFFPKSYLREQGVVDWMANVILNITIVDDNLNKRIIGSKPPSEYISPLWDQNSQLPATLRTHLIDGIKEFGVSDDNYDLFLEKRSKRVIDELKLRLGEAMI